MTFETVYADAPAPGSPADVVRTWDARAEHYLRLFRHELHGKPFDLEALHAFADRVGVGGKVYDAGCGPCGHVTALLASRGLDVLGIDLSSRCVELARREQPGCRFAVMDQGAIGAGPLDGLVAYYSLHDQPKRLLPATLASWASAIRPGGQLLIVAKEGMGDGVIDDPWAVNSACIGRSSRRTSCARRPGTRASASTTARSARRTRTRSRPAASTSRPRGARRSPGETRSRRWAAR